MNKVVNDFSVAGSGLVVYGASMGTELALEDAKWDRHGAFAEALIEAIGEGKASIDSTGAITTDMLDSLYRGTREGDDQRRAASGHEPPRPHSRFPARAGASRDGVAAAPRAWRA